MYDKNILRLVTATQVHERLSISACGRLWSVHIKRSSGAVEIFYGDGYVFRMDMHDAWHFDLSRFLVCRVEAGIYLVFDMQCMQ